MENADRFSPCPMNDLDRCVLHYFGASDSVIVEKGTDNKIRNPDLSDIFGRIRNMEAQILDEEDQRINRYRKPSSAQRFMAVQFDNKC